MLVRKELYMEVMIIDDKIKSILKGKNTYGNSKDWMSPWHRLVHITGLPKVFSRSLPYLNFHTRPWGNTSNSSESRIRKETISSAIVEYSSVMLYRPKLLQMKDSSAGWIRASIDSFLATGTMEGKGRPLPGGQEETTPLIRTISWPDGLEYDHDTVLKFSNSPFNILTETFRLERRLARERDTLSIQKIIKALQSCPPAWDVSPGQDLNTISSSNGRALRPEIREKANELIQVSIIFRFYLSLSLHALTSHRLWRSALTSTEKRPSTSTP